MQAAVAPRRAEPRAARGGRDDRGAAARARRRRQRQDPRAHPPHRLADRRLRHPAGGDPGGHLHQQGRRRDARAGREAARRRGLRALALDLPLHVRADPAARDRPPRPLARLRDLRRGRLPRRREGGPEAPRPRSRRSPTRAACSGASTSGRTRAGCRRPPPRPRSTSRIAAPPRSTPATSACSPTPTRSTSTTCCCARTSSSRAFRRCCATTGSRFQYVLVDEYQDTNRVQYELVRQLAGEHRNLCVVGDPDQSIYAWRGADLRNILDFERDHPGAQVVTLERNYRSTQPILTGATAVVANNLARRSKSLFTDRQDGEPIRVFEARNDREEAQFVVRQMLAGVREEGRPYGDFAIFYRTNAQSRLFEEALLKYDVPYVVVGGVRFYDRAEVKDALAYLRLALNPADPVALRRIVNKPPRGHRRPGPGARRGAGAGAGALAARRPAGARGRRRRSRRAQAAPLPRAARGAGARAAGPRARRTRSPSCSSAAAICESSSRRGPGGGGARREPARAGRGGRRLRPRERRRRWTLPARALPRPGRAGLGPRRLRPARRSRLADDGALGQGSRVPGGLRGRPGGGHLPALGVDPRRGRPRGGAAPLLRGDDARDGAAGAHLRRGAPALRRRAAGACRRASCARSRRRCSPLPPRRGRRARPPAPTLDYSYAQDEGAGVVAAGPARAASDLRAGHGPRGLGQRAPARSSASASSAPASRPSWSATPISSWADPAGFC